MSSSAALLTTLVLLSAAVLPLDVSAGGGFSIELIHRDSPKSPYYNSSATHFDRIRAASIRSISRAAQIGLLHALPSASSEFQAQLTPDNGNYLMRVTIGSPPVERLLLVDTGSAIIWTQCTPCINCYRQNAPLFNPAESSTYKKVSYSSPACQSMRNTMCDTRDNSCRYAVQYADNSHSFGTLSTETFGFDSTTGQADGGVRFPNLVFGCSTNSAGSFNPTTVGMVGLGSGPGSLITQLSSTINGKFSYCLVPYSRSSASSLMSFGDRAVVTGDGAVTTPLVTREPSISYHVSLEYINVGGTNKKIAVKSAREFASNPGNVVFDTGATLTLLDEDVVSKVEKQVLSVVHLPRATPPQGNLFRLCYDSSHMRPNSDLPYMKFKYTGGSVKMRPMNIFLSPAAGIVCLGILPNNGPGVNTIGSIAQQNFHIGYDVHAMTLTIAPANCASL